MEFLQEHIVIAYQSISVYIKYLHFMGFFSVLIYLFANKVELLILACAAVADGLLLCRGKSPPGALTHSLPSFLLLLT